LRRCLWSLRIDRWHIVYPDREIHSLHLLCRPSAAAVDIGAAQGAYCAHMLTCSRMVWAFEPRREAARDLVATYANAPVKVCFVALSDRNGQGVIRVCEADQGRSTMERNNPVHGVEQPAETANRTHHASWWRGLPPALSVPSYCRRHPATQQPGGQTGMCLPAPLGDRSRPTQVGCGYYRLGENLPRAQRNDA